MKLRNFLLGFFCLFSAIVVGNQRKLDSLALILKACDSDSCKVSFYSKMAVQGLKLNDSLGFAYMDSSYGVATQSGSEERMSFASYYYGVRYFRKGNYPKAMEKLLLSLRHSEHALDTANMCRALYLISAVYIRQKNAHLSKEYLDRSLQLATLINDSNRISQCMYGYGAFYYDVLNVNPDSGYYYLNKALKIHLAMGKKSRLKDDYNALGANAQRRGNNRQAVSYYLK